MNYSLHQLKIFVSVCEHISITNAANEMNMTQPALSIQLKNFQNQFEVPLIEKKGRKIVVTEFGYQIKEIAEKILLEAEALKFKTKEYKGLFTGRLKIASASTGKYVIPYFLETFLDRYPGIDLSLDVSNKTEVIKSLTDHKIELALVSVPPENVNYQEELLMENTLHMISKIGDTRETPPLIFREKGSATRKVMDDHLQIKKNRKSLELTSNEAVKQAILAGLGNSVLPLIGIKNELKKDLQITKTAHFPIRTQWRLIWLANRKLTPIAEAYLEFVRDNKKTIIAKHFSWLNDI